MSQTEHDEASGVGTLSAPWSLSDRIVLKSTSLGILSRNHRHVLDDLHARIEAGSPEGDAIFEWAEAWHLDAEWIKVVALGTVTLWRSSNEETAKRWIVYPVATWGPSGTSSFEYVPWTPDSGLSESEFNRQTLRTFRAHLHQEALATNSERQAKGFVGHADRPSAYKHLVVEARRPTIADEAAAVAARARRPRSGRVGVRRVARHRFHGSRPCRTRHALGTPARLRCE